MRVIDNLQGRSPAIGIDATGKLVVKASVAGAGSTTIGQIYKMKFDDYGWTATTLALTTGTLGERYFIGIAEGTITSGLSTASPGAITDSHMYSFVIGGPTIMQSTCAAGTTGQGVTLTTGAVVPSVTGATYRGGVGEFAVFRRGWIPSANAYSSAVAISTSVTDFGSLSTGTQFVYLPGLMQIVSS